jgi:hypothetical protein
VIFRYWILYIKRTVTSSPAPKKVGITAGYAIGIKLSPRSCCMPSFSDLSNKRLGLQQSRPVWRREHHHSPRCVCFWGQPQRHFRNLGRRHVCLCDPSVRNHAVRGGQHSRPARGGINYPGQHHACDCVRDPIHYYNFALFPAHGSPRGGGF